MRQLLRVLVFALTVGCLRVPPPPIATDASVSEDATAEPAPLAVTGVVVRALDGTPWPASAAPRRARIEIEWSGEPFVEADEELPVWVFVGAPDDALAEDLARSPVRAANRARIVPATTNAADRRWCVELTDRLDSDTTLTIAVGGWVRSATTGERLDAPFLAVMRTSPSPDAGAEVTATWPPDGAAAVSPSMGTLAVRFDGPISIPEGSLGLYEGDREESSTVERIECTEVGWGDGWCARLIPVRPLRQGSAHRLVVSERVRDATGAPVGPWEAHFATAAVDDLEGPRLASIPCAIDELVTALGCALVGESTLEIRMNTAEPTRFALSVADRTLLAVAPRGEAHFVVEDLLPESLYELTVFLEDTGGRRAIISDSLSTTERLAPISIVEVRSDPRGSEPTQEYVELLHYGDMPIDLDGFALADRPDAIGDVIEGRTLVSPGERVLLVADRFDPDDTEDDPVVPAGVRLIRLGTSLAGGGLSNAGEPLFLRDPLGRRLSGVPPLPTGAGLCAHVVDGDPSAFSVAPCTPGRP